MPDEPMLPAAATYTYGDSAVAGDRLAVLAQIFGPTTEAFLRRDAPPGVDLAVDLGCGPGHTTALIHRVVAPRATVGLERSDAFVLRARIEHPSPADRPLRFLPHDVTITPFPCGSADVLVARYLLAHLPDPLLVAARWLTQLQPDGRLLVEEIDHIDTSIDTFGRYLEVVTAMSAGHDTDLLVGAALAGGPAPIGGALVAGSTATISPDPRTVARIFAMNLSVWRHDPWVAANLDPAAVDALDRELADLGAEAPASGITWHHRQLVYRRA